MEPRSPGIFIEVPLSNTAIGTLVQDDYLDQSVLNHDGTQILSFGCDQSGIRAVPLGSVLQQDGVSVVSSKRVKGFQANNSGFETLQLYGIENSNELYILTNQIGERSFMIENGQVSIKSSDGHSHKDDRDLSLEKESLTCSICHDTIDHWSDFKSHVKGHETDKNLNCEFCSKKFNQRKNLALHTAIHQTENFNCPECHRRFSRFSSLKAHLLVHGEEDNITCLSCEDEFVDLTSYLKHCETKHLSRCYADSDTKFVCSECPAIFQTAEGLKKHSNKHRLIKKMTTSKIKKGQQLPDETKKYQCSYCTKAFKKPSLLARHERIHTGDKPFKCTLCTRQFNQSNALSMHLRKHTGYKPHVCEFCNQRFSQKANLCGHVLRVHSINVNETEVGYTCVQCSCTFKTVGSLNAHTSKLHQPSVNSIIVECSPESYPMPSKKSQSVKLSKRADQVSSDKRWIQPESFPDLNHLKTDTLSGENESSKPFLQAQPQDCDEMDTSLTNGQRLKDFLHSCNKASFVILQDKPPRIPDSARRKFQCSKCMKAFKRKAHLKTHLLTHSEGRSYKCTTCDKSFVTPIILKGHLTTHQKKGLFQCSECTAVFTRASSVKRHLSKHSPNEKFLCKICKKYFPTLKCIRTHLKKDHTEKVFRPHIRKVVSDSHPTKSDYPFFDINGENGLQFVGCSINTIEENIFLTENLQLNIELENATQDLESNSISQTFSCSWKGCGDTFTSLDALGDHLGVFHDTLKGIFHKRKRDRQEETPVDPKLVSNICLDNREISVKCLLSSLAEKDKIVQKQQQVTKSGTKYRHKCKLCPKSFQRPSDLIRHIRVHTGEKPFSCDKCGKSFSVRSTLVHHMKTHENPEQWLECHICNLKFCRKSSLQLHMRLHTGVKPFLCEHCNQRFRTSAEMSAHIVMYHTITEVNSQVSSLLQDSIDVHDPSASKVIISSESLLQALEAVSQVGESVVGTRIHLEIPGLENESAYLKVDEELITQLKVGGQISVNVPFLAQSSEKLPKPTIEVPKVLISEAFIHSEATPEETNQSSTDQLKHERKVSQENDIVELIETPTQNSSDSTELISTSFPMQAERLKYKCSICKKGFPKPSQLTRHLRVHSGERPFGCEVCSKRFTQKSSLKIHMQNHFGERPHVCEFCHYRFSQKHNLKVHIKRAHQEEALPV